MAGLLEPPVVPVFAAAFVYYGINKYNTARCYSTVPYRSKVCDMRWAQNRWQKTAAGRF